MQTSPLRQDQEPLFQEDPTPVEDSTQKKQRKSKIKLEDLNSIQIKTQKQGKETRVDDWVVPVQEDKSTTTRMVHFNLKFDDLDYDQENLLHVVYYIFKGHFDIIVTQNSSNKDGTQAYEKVKKIKLTERV